MARELEIRRHTDNDGDVLSDDGVTAAVELGRGLGADYDLVVSSGAQRATQTAACLLAGLGRPVPDGVIVHPGVRSDREDEWRDAYSESGSGELEAFREVAPDLVASESEVLSGALEDVLDRLDDGGRALVVGHSPTNEAAVLGLTAETVASLGKGEGVLVTVDGDATSVTRLE